MSIVHTCFKCGRRMELDPVFVGIELSKLKVKNPRYYQAQCPACQSTTKVPVDQMKEDLEAVAEEIEVGIAEVEKVREAAREAKRAAAKAKREAQTAKEKKS